MPLASSGQFDLAGQVSRIQNQSGVGHGRIVDFRSAFGDQAFRFLAGPGQSCADKQLDNGNALGSLGR